MATDTLAINLASDYLTWERLEPISYYPAPVADDKAVVVNKAKRRAPTTKEQMASGGVYTATDLVWLVPRLEAPALAEQFPPKPGDAIEDGDLTLWTVLSVMPYGALRSFWRLMTRNLVLAYDLRDEVAILRPEITIGDALEPVFAWPTDPVPGGIYVVADLPARVQPTDGTITIRNEVKTNQDRFTVILGANVDLRAGDRVLVTKGTRKGQVLRWINQQNEDRIDELPFLTCERV